MRKKLAGYKGTRRIFTGTFVRFGKKSGYRYDRGTVLLTNIHIERENNISELVCYHLWFNLTKDILQLWRAEELHVGAILRFSGRVGDYVKGYYKDRYDYKIAYPRVIEIIGFDNKFKDQLCDPPLVWEEERQKIIDKIKMIKEEKKIVSEQPLLKETPRVERSLFDYV